MGGDSTPPRLIRNSRSARAVRITWAVAGVGGGSRIGHPPSVRRRSRAGIPIARTLHGLNLMDTMDILTNGISWRDSSGGLVRKGRILSQLRVRMIGRRVRRSRLLGEQLAAVVVRVRDRAGLTLTLTLILTG